MRDDLTIEVSYDHSVLTGFRLYLVGPGPIAQVEFISVATLPVGEYVGTIGFRVCRTNTCAEKYSDVPATLGYRLTVSTAPPAAIVTPPSFTSTIEAGSPLEVLLSAETRPDITTPHGTVAFSVTDTHGLFVPTPTSVSQGGNQYALTLTGVELETPGVYSGTVNLVVCRVAACPDIPAAGSPVAIPYVVTVIPSSALAPIPTITGLPEWETYQGNPSHTGYVPVTLNTATFASLWSWVSPFPVGTWLSPVTTGSGKAVVSVTGVMRPAYLLALKETDGSTVWRHEFGEIDGVTDPATSIGRVFVATKGAQAAMWGFSLSNGQLLFRTPFPAQHQSYLAPTFRDSTVYANGGAYGGLFAYRALTGVARWNANLEQYDLWTPAVDETYAYAYAGYEFVAIRRTDGARELSVRNEAFGGGTYSMNSAPVIAAPDTILVVDGVSDHPHDNHLIRYSVAGRNEVWRVQQRFMSNPVVAAGQIYIVNAVGNSLEARDLSTGAHVWSWTPPNASDIIPDGNLIVTDNLVFVSTATGTFAIDIASRRDVWSTPRTGHLALSSNGVLYIVARTRIDAYDLL
jgi:outer membrane protein assembly factor BamB